MAWLYLAFLLRQIDPRFHAGEFLTGQCTAYQIIRTHMQSACIGKLFVMRALTEGPIHNTTHQHNRHTVDSTFCARATL